MTTGGFADYCVAKFDSLSSILEMLKRTTVYGRFSAPRTMTTRRVLALPHPASQMTLSLIIAQERKNIATIIRSSPLTLYKTNLKSNRSRAFSGLNFRMRVKQETAILAQYPFVLMADIANFFHTIYSHSIPWAVLTKEHVKEAREKKWQMLADVEKHWCSLLDTALQRGNSRETFGIPVGPDTSRIIAEILLAGIHNDKGFRDAAAANKGYRLVDDFFIRFETEAAAGKCLDALRHVLWEYNLHLNEGKTRIVSASAVYGESWRHELESFQFDDSTLAKQRDSVQHLMDITLRQCAARQDAQPASFFCRRLLGVGI